MLLPEGFGGLMRWTTTEKTPDYDLITLTRGMSSTEQASGHFRRHYPFETLHSLTVPERLLPIRHKMMRIRKQCKQIQVPTPQDCLQ
jgi:hypothetical protein